MALAALNEPARRRVYRYVAMQEAPVSRDGVAAALGVPRSVAAFHLEKLANLGLLEFEYRRPPGRNGPGAGRPAKMYRRASSEIVFSVPERHYGLAAELLAQAVEAATDRSVPVADALRAVAREHGRFLGSRLQPLDGHSRRQMIERLVDLMADQGYEPDVKDNRIVLRNCPFHALTAEHRELVCGMNLELIAGVVESGRVPDTAARLEPAPGRCCVSLYA
jgi:predicted ArsR family transcriptional regulator